MPSNVRGPLVAGAGAERRREGRPLGRPGVGVVLLTLDLHPQPRHQLGPERRLERPHGDEPAVGALVDGVERRPAVEQVGLALVAPAPDAEQPVHHREQVRGAVDHRGVDDLPPPGGAAGDQRREHPDDEVHRAAGEVTDHAAPARPGAPPCRARAACPTPRRT